MIDNQLTSVVIPVYNGERYLAEAIDSVLSQNLPVEVIVVDDGSTDASASVAGRYSPRVQCHQIFHSGISAARNRGVELATGEYLAFLDSDDFWTVNKLSIQVSEFKKNPSTGIVFGHVKQFISPELNDSLSMKIHCPAGIMPGYHPGAMLIRRRDFLRVGLFSTECRAGEFIDWYARAKESSLTITMLPELVMWRRLHDQNHGIRQKSAYTDYLKIIKQSIDRRQTKKH